MNPSILRSLCGLLYTKNYIVLHDLIRFTLSCASLYRHVYQNPSFWKQMIANRLLEHKALPHVDLDEREALHMLLDLRSNYELSEYLKYRYMKMRLEAPVQSKLHLRFYIRIDTVGLGCVTLVGRCDDDREPPELVDISRRVGRYDRDANGKLKIGQLSERQFRKSKEDATFQKDRFTNNNGLVEYDAVPQKEHKKAKRPLLQYPNEEEFIFERLDKKTVVEWVETSQKTTYFGRLSTRILYPIDRSSTTPNFVKDISSLNIFPGYYDYDRGNVADPEFFKTLLSKEHSLSLFEDIEPILAPYIRTFRRIKYWVKYSRLYEHYGPK